VYRPLAVTVLHFFPEAKTLPTHKRTTQSIRLIPLGPNVARLLSLCGARSQASPLLAATVKGAVLSQLLG
jgi:hypothetical protein